MSFARMLRAMRERAAASFSSFMMQYGDYIAVSKILNLLDLCRRKKIKTHTNRS